MQHKKNQEAHTTKTPDLVWKTLIGCKTTDPNWINNQVLLILQLQETQNSSPDIPYLITEVTLCRFTL